MLDAILFIGLAYLAIVVGLVGIVYRLRTAAPTPQLRKALVLLWGGIPWHLAIQIILLAHLLELIFRYPWQRLVSVAPALWIIEGLGLTLAVVSLVGVFTFLIRTLLAPSVRAVMGGVDLLLLGLLLWQVLSGIGMAVLIRWGTVWSTSTTVPYVLSLLALHPADYYVTVLPLLVQAHIIGAWVFLLLLPFSRVLYRLILPQPIPPEPAPVAETDLSRRQFLRGLTGIIGGVALLGITGLYGLGRYLMGPRLNREQQVSLDEERLLHLEQTTEERDLVLQREREDYIFVAALSELSRSVGKYFTDYQLRPALAFLGTDGLPMCISAKCTHLGCTVGNVVDTHNLILCPCHISYFNIDTGVPLPGSPAKLPLPHIGWVLTDAQGMEIASRTPDGLQTGRPTAAQLSGARVFIAKRFAGGA